MDRRLSKAQRWLWALHCKKKKEGKKVEHVHIRPQSKQPGSHIVQEGAIQPPQPRFSPDQELFIKEETQSNILSSFSALHSPMRVNACNDL